MNKLKKKIIIVLAILVILTPTGILLPMVFNANDAWGEWSAETMKTLIGYVPEGLQKYSDAYKAPLPDYSLNGDDPSTTHQSLYYILSGFTGVIATFGLTFLISKLIIKHGKQKHTSS